MRDGLIELVKQRLPYGVCVGEKSEQHFCEKVADYLLANGVIVLPCKVGDTVYYITGIHNTLVKEAKVEEIYVGEAGFAFHLCHDYTYFTVQQEDVFLTREAAERALKGR